MDAAASDNRTNEGRTTCGVLPPAAPTSHHKPHLESTRQNQGELILIVLSLLLWLRPTSRSAWNRRSTGGLATKIPPSYVVISNYDDPSAGTSRLALINYLATCPASECLAIILSNVRASFVALYEFTSERQYGGPGNPGKEESFTHAPHIQNFTGNRHDIISFDQRGLGGHSLPKINCFGSALE
ncbi:hypothetical protein DFH09DRAFT_1074687 [Mycena vulgaris]|nr:hypothetical protein DFH09DRAFT_1074687 [Mycena vulgaris]